MRLLNNVIDGFSHLLFPQLCMGCSEPLTRNEDTLCLSCYQELPHTGYHLVPDNEAALRFAGRVPYQHVTSLAHYVKDGLLQHLIGRMKYGKQKPIGTFLGKQLGITLAKSTWHPEIDLIVPMPLHPKKQASRGFNQTIVIADGLGTELDREVSSKALRRIINTKSQVSKSREERVLNMTKAFSIAKPETLTGRHVLLIDDVLTTGATLEAAALCLLQVPNLKVSMATIGLAAG